MASESDRRASEHEPVIPPRVLIIPGQDEIRELADRGGFRLVSADAGLQMEAFNVGIEFEPIGCQQKTVEDDPDFIAALMDLLCADNAHVRKSTVELA